MALEPPSFLDHHASMAVAGRDTEVLSSGTGKKQPLPTTSPAHLLEQPYLTVAEVAQLLRKTPKAIYAMYERGQLPRSALPGRRLLFCKTRLLEWLSRASSLPRRSRR
jgi:excisionase family DNA binding protein